MTPELKFLAWTAALTALLWIPYILNVIAVNGLNDAVSYPPGGLKMAPWAERLKKAHYNAVENMVLFTALVLICTVLEISNLATTSAAAAYFWARAVHPVAYALAVPWIRTLSFLVGWGALVCMLWQILG